MGVAGYFLHALIHQKDEAVISDINNWKYGLKAIMVMLNCQTIADLQKQKLILKPELRDYLKQRQIDY